MTGTMSHETLTIFNSAICSNLPILQFIKRKRDNKWTKEFYGNVVIKSIVSSIFIFMNYSADEQCLSERFNESNREPHFIINI